MSRYQMTIDGKPMEVNLTETGPGRFRAEVGGKVHEVQLQGGVPGASYAAPAPVVMAAPAPAPVAPAPAPMATAAPMVAPPPPVVRAAAPAAAVTAGARAVSAPMPGKVIAINAKVGDAVKRGAPVITIEAMKMNVPIPAPLDGKVVKVLVAVGDSVQAGQAIAEVSA
jgi:pyruvate dehydrogenase E2 component (dihydrolipoamide acetyltransferase)